MERERMGSGWGALSKRDWGRRSCLDDVENGNMRYDIPLMLRSGLSGKDLAAFFNTADRFDKTMSCIIRYSRNDVRQQETTTCA